MHKLKIPALGEYIDDMVQKTFTSSAQSARLAAIEVNPPPLWPVWEIYCTWGSFSKIILPKSFTFVGNFCNGFIFLVKSFLGNFKVPDYQIIHASHLKCVELYLALKPNLWPIGREPWSSGYGRRLTFLRSWVRIPAPDAGWTWHFFTLNCCKTCIVCLKRPKINEKEAVVGPFKKKQFKSKNLWL